MRGYFFLLIDFGHRPDSRGDVALGAWFVQPVIDRDQFAVGISGFADRPGLAAIQASCKHAATRADRIDLMQPFFLRRREIAEVETYQDFVTPLPDAVVSRPSCKPVFLVKNLQMSGVLDDNCIIFCR